MDFSPSALDINTVETTAPVEETKTKPVFIDKERSKSAEPVFRRKAPRRKAANVYVRIRPLAKQGTHAKSDASDKYIVGWNKSQITMNYVSRVQRFNYMDLVMGPEIGQDEAFTVTMPELIDSFLTGYNCTFIAYGQTGTGKTHTVFGAPSSLRLIPETGDIHEQWGLFPRAITTMMRKMKDHSHFPYLFTVSVIEIYLGVIYDLLNDKAEVQFMLSTKGHLFGMKEVKLMSTEEVKNVIHIAMNQRVSSGTKCNQNSSRSHCLAHINLFTYELGKVVERTFIFGDLSGSERVKKTEQPKWIDRDAYKMFTPGLEGIMTNWDLYMLGMQLQLIAETIKRRGQGKSIVKHESRLSDILAKSLDGSAITSVILCLSQSSYNGGETWYSMNYGAKFRRLVTKVEPQQGKKLKQLFTEIDSQIKEQEYGIRQVLSTPNKGKANLFHEMRKMRLRQLKEKREFFEFFESIIAKK